MRRLWEHPVGRRPSFWRRLTPPQLLLGSFALLILLGTLGLKFLPGLYTGKPLGWLDALFTSASAVCVTGLAVVDTATYFTPRGQAYILLLVQLGGLGTLTFTSLVIVALGGRVSLRQEALAVGNPMDVGYHKINPRWLVRDVVLFTFAFEAVGAAFLYALWVPRLGWEGAAWPAVFHAVSAFCNAGFSTFSDSLTSFRTDPPTLVVISALVVAGGIGFLTMEELYLRRKAQRQRRVFRLSLHTRLVLVTTAVVIFAPWPVLAWLEWDAALAGMGPGHKLTNALFVGAGARTAGFNTVDHAKATEAGNFLTILLMSVGGSPGSMAGGMKTTTLALLAVLAWSRLRGQEVATVWGRSLRKETTDRAVGLFVIVFVVATAGILALTVTEQGSAAGGFLGRMFEAVSAFNIVGLSMGLTPHLSPAGRGVVIVLMFLGRVGPLAVAAALTVRAPGAGKFRYAYEEVAVG
jgi:trk system potassium uptake protein TrkH